VENNELIDFWVIGSYDAVVMLTATNRDAVAPNGKRLVRDVFRPSHVLIGQGFVQEDEDVVSAVTDTQHLALGEGDDKGRGRRSICLILQIAELSHH